MAESDGGQLEVDKLFKGLTRPPMILGVSFSFAVLNLCLSFISYLVTNKMKFIVLLMPCIHLIAYIICFKEPLFLELFLTRSQKCSLCINKLYHGANSYDVN